MSRYTQAVEEKTSFDGDEVTYTLRRMKNKHMLIVAPAISIQDGNLLARTSRLSDASKSVVLECVSNLNGLKDSAGGAIPIEIVLEEAYFLPLVDEILGKLIKISVLQEDDAKKSIAPPPVPSSGESANNTP